MTQPSEKAWTEPSVWLFSLYKNGEYKGYGTPTFMTMAVMMRDYMEFALGTSDPAAFVERAKRAIEWCDAEMELMKFPLVRETEEHRHEFRGAARRCMAAKAAYRSLCTPAPTTKEAGHGE